MTARARMNGGVLGRVLCVWGIPLLMWTIGGPRVEAAPASDHQVVGASDSPPEGAAPGRGQGLSADALVILAGGFVGGGAVLLFFFFVWPVVGRGATLSSVIDRAPELHTAVAFLIGTLRRELLRPRVAAVGDLLGSLRSHSDGGPKQRFFWQRLFDGASVDEAWQSHLRAFSRTIGRELNLRRDHRFRRAGRAISAIARSEARHPAEQARTVRALERAHQQLREFDRYLAGEQARLVRTRVETALLRQVADEVMGEQAFSTTPLPDVDVREVVAPVCIEMPRGDLLFVVKGLLN